LKVHFLLDLFDKLNGLNFTRSIRKYNHR